MEGEAAVVAVVAPGEAEGHFMRSREMKIPEVDLAAGGGGAEIAAERRGKEYPLIRTQPPEKFRRTNLAPEEYLSVFLSFQ